MSLQARRRILSSAFTAITVGSRWPTGVADYRPVTSSSPEESGTEAWTTSRPVRSQLRKLADRPQGFFGIKRSIMRTSILPGINGRLNLDLQAHATELYRHDKPLTILVVFNLILVVCMLVLLAFDSRLVMGSNPWIKPIKFALSFALYAYTVARLLEYLRLSNWGKQIISWAVSVTILTQIVCITIQAARGTTSHYNMTTSGNAAIAVIMDIMDPLNGLVVVILLVLACMAKYDVTRPCLWGIRTGLAIFLGASAIGVVMVAYGAHSIGVEDGGPGLPVLNWSTTGGDLRVAHFVGLHALQVLPVCAWLISKHDRWSLSQQTRGVLVLSAVYALIVVILYLQAIHGAPFLPV